MEQTLLQKKSLPDKFKKISFLIFGIGLLTVIISFFVDSHRFAFNYNILFSFLVSIALGNMFLFAIEYLAGAVWSTVFRRINEIFISFVPFVMVIGIVVLLEMHSIFHWTHKDVLENDEIVRGKTPYLNETFFIIRFFVYTLVWTLFAYFMRKNSLKQDTTYDQNLTYRNSKLSAFFIPIFAITITFFAIDYLMSTEPHWFSTIFGVYYFSGTVLSALAILTVVSILLHERSYFDKILKPDHFYNLGALLFAFVNFWAYIAFSQFLLIWYANLPEETFWMIHRWENGWEIFSFILIFGHFLIPYFALLSQQAKSNLNRLKIVSIWLLIMHYVDIYWLTMPSGFKQLVFGWIELGFIVFCVGIIMILFYYRYERMKNIIPVGDPKLKRSLEFKL